MDKNYAVRKGESREGQSGSGLQFHMGLGAGQQKLSEKLICG